MKEQFISGNKRKGNSKVSVPKPAKGGKLSKKGQVYKNNLMNADYTGSPKITRKPKVS